MACDGETLGTMTMDSVNRMTETEATADVASAPGAHPLGGRREEETKKLRGVTTSVYERVLGK